MPGGRLIEWTSASVTSAPGGRGPWLGESTRRAPAHQPSDQASSPAAFAIEAVAAHADAEARHAIAHLAQRQPEARAGRGAIEAMTLQRAQEDVALDLVEVGGEVVG